MPNLMPSVSKTTKVALSGGDVEIRSLTAREAMIVDRTEDADESNILGIHFATDDPLDHVRAWYIQATADDALTLVRAITRHSGLSGDAQFPNGTGNDDGPAPTP